MSGQRFAVVALYVVAWISIVALGVAVVNSLH